MPLIDTNVPEPDKCRLPRVSSLSIAGITGLKVRESGELRIDLGVLEGAIWSQAEKNRAVPGFFDSVLFVVLLAKSAEKSPFLIVVIVIRHWQLAPECLQCGCHGCVDLVFDGLYWTVGYRWLRVTLVLL